MSTVHEIKFFKKKGELFAALFDKPSRFLPEFWIKNIKASELGFTKLPKDIKLECKYKVQDLGIKPFEASKKGLAFGIADSFNRVTRELGKEMPKHVTNNQTININQGGYHQQTGNFGIGHMSGGEIEVDAKVAGIITKAENQDLADLAREIQQLLDKEIICQLEQRAELNGFSVESELDKILKTIFSPKTEKKSLKKLLLEMPDVGEDADFCCRLDSTRQIDL